MASTTTKIAIASFLGGLWTGEHCGAQAEQIQKDPTRKTDDEEWVDESFLRHRHAAKDVWNEPAKLEKTNKAVTKKKQRILERNQRHEARDVHEEPPTISQGRLRRLRQSRRRRRTTGKIDINFEWAQANSQKFNQEADVDTTALAGAKTAIEIGSDDRNPPAPTIMISTFAPTSSNFTQAPTPSAFTQAPTPSAFTQAPTPSAFTQAPTPSAFTQAPTPSAFTQAPTIPLATGMPTAGPTGSGPSAAYTCMTGASYSMINLNASMPMMTCPNGTSTVEVGVYIDGSAGEVGWAVRRNGVLTGCVQYSNSGSLGLDNTYDIYGAYVAQGDSANSVPSFELSNCDCFEIQFYDSGGDGLEGTFYVSSDSVVLYNGNLNGGNAEEAGNRTGWLALTDAC